MSINYRKIKSQIRPMIKPGEYEFFTTAEQDVDNIVPLLASGRAAKRRIIEIVAFWANSDTIYAKHFKL